MAAIPPMARLYEDVNGMGEGNTPVAPPYETLSRVRDKSGALRIDQPGEVANPVMISPPYAEASVIKGDMNPLARLHNVSHHATVMEVFPDDAPDDVLGGSCDGLNNGGSFLDAERPYDQGLLRNLSPSQVSFVHTLTA